MKNVSISKRVTLSITDCKVSLKKRGQNTSVVTSRKVSPERLLSVWQQSIVWLTFRSCHGTVSHFCQLGWWQRAHDNKFWHSWASSPVAQASDLLVPQYSEVSCLEQRNEKDSKSSWIFWQILHSSGSWWIIFIPNYQINTVKKFCWQIQDKSIFHLGLNAFLFKRKLWS